MKKQNLPRPKTRFVGYVAATIDGRISLTEKKRPDWTSKEDWKFFQKALAQADAVVVGRNTFEAARSRLSKRNTFVFSSRTWGIEKKGAVTFINPANADIAKLFAGYKTVAVIGGGSVYRVMLESGLLDELFVTIEPLIFGRGKEMFTGGTKTTRLKLVSVKKLNKAGTLLLHYRV